MKIERINENQIRCTLTSFDLSSRNINLVELVYGTEKARRLFREMIQQAADEVGFEAEDIPLMVEAIPLSGESLMVLITRVEEPEELDSRFAKFTPSPGEDEEDGPGLFARMAADFLEGAARAQGNRLEGSGEEEPQANGAAKGCCRIFRFDSLDRILEAAAAVGNGWKGTNSLYRKPDTRQYYLVLRREQQEDENHAFSRVCNVLAEYGTRLPNEYASEAYFREHYKTVAAGAALQKLSQI